MKKEQKEKDSITTKSPLLKLSTYKILQNVNFVNSNKADALNIDYI